MKKFYFVLLGSMFLMVPLSYAEDSVNTPPSGEIKKDVQETKEDHKEMRGDRREKRGDHREFRGDRRELRCGDRDEGCVERFDNAACHPVGESSGVSWKYPKPPLPTIEHRIFVRYALC